MPPFKIPPGDGGSVFFRPASSGPRAYGHGPRGRAGLGGAVRGPTARQRDECVEQGRIYIEPFNKGVSATLKERSYTVVGGPNVGCVLDARTCPAAQCGAAHRSPAGVALLGLQPVARVAREPQTAAKGQSPTRIDTWPLQAGPPASHCQPLPPRPERASQALPAVGRGGASDGTLCLLVRSLTHGPAPRPGWGGARRGARSAKGVSRGKQGKQGRPEAP